MNKAFLYKALAATATTAAVDPEPVTKTAVTGVAVIIGTTIVTCVVAEGIQRAFRWLFD